MYRAVNELLFNIEYYNVFSSKNKFDQGNNPRAILMKLKRSSLI